MRRGTGFGPRRKEFRGCGVVRSAQHSSRPRRGLEASGLGCVSEKPLLCSQPQFPHLHSGRDRCL